MSEFVPGAPTGYIRLLREIAGVFLRRKVEAKFHSASIPAGEESIMAELDGPGVLEFVIFTVVGSSTDARKSRVVVERDGERIEYPTIQEVGWTTGSWNTPKIFVSGWDDSAYSYSMGLELSMGFRKSCVVKIANGDQANGVSCNCIVMHAKVEG